MYQGGGVAGKKSELEEQDESERQEEFLLGKEYAPQGVTTGDFAQAADANEGVNAVVVRLSPFVVVVVRSIGENCCSEEGSFTLDWACRFSLHLQHQPTDQW